MSITSRRRAKLIGGALFAASLAAGSFATTIPVSADLGDAPYVLSYIRVQPAGNTWENQAAPVIQAGSTGAAAATVEILIPTNWESGDKITLQVYADNDAGIAGQQTNCLDAARSISFAGPYATSNVVAAPIGYLDANGWAGLDDGNTVANAGTFGPVPDLDPKTPDPTQPGIPTYTVALTTSPSCVGVGVTDQIELTFSNTSAAPDGGQYSIAFTNIKYNVGAAVPAGPVHVVPFVRQADDVSAGNYISIDAFGTNMYNTPATIDTWTDNAYISPVSISATGTSIVGDGSFQSLGSITLTETAPDALGNGTHVICLSSISNVTGPATAVVTGTVGATATVTYLGNCITVTLGLMGAGAINTVTISGLIANSGTDGTVLASLTPGTGGNWPSYLNPDDQTQGNSGYYSDVNVGAYPVAPFTFVVGVPARIGGNDRYETSAKIAANLYHGGDSCSDWAVLVSGTSYPDALSASYLAGALNSNVGWTGDFAAVPVLLIGFNSIPPSVSAFMAAAGVKNVYIVGGNAVVSAAAEAALLNTAATKCTWHTTIGDTAPVPNQKLSVVRVSGADRYATNRAVVNLGSDIFEEGRNRVSLEILQPTKHTAIIATGTGFADALAAGPVSYDGLPLILTDGTSLSTSARLTLTDNDIAQVIIIGGTSAVSAAVEAQIQAMGITTGRVAGADRYATATAWADFMFGGCAAAPVAGAYDCGYNWTAKYAALDQILLASGVNFADALSAGPMGWAWDAPIILSDPTTLSANTQTWLVANRLALRWVTVLGLGSAVSTGVMNAANLAIS